MLKKLMVGTLVTVLSTGIAVGSVSAAEVDFEIEKEDYTNDLEVTIKPGFLEFDMNSTDLTFSWDINQSLDSFKLTAAEDGVLNYSIEDNRGIADEVEITHKLSDFTHTDGETTLKPNLEELNLDTAEFNPEENTNEEWNDLDLSEIEFESKDTFVKAGVYEAELVTNVTSSAEPYPEPEE